MKASSGWLSRKRRREAAYRRGYEAGLAAATASCDPVAYLRHGEQTFVQNVPFGAMWISDKDDPRSFPVYDRPQRPAPSVAVKALDWEANGEGWRGCGSIIYDVYPVAEGEGWWAALSMAGYLPFRERCKSPEEAKAAAQADYETRIRSALSRKVPDVADSPAIKAIVAERARQIEKEGWSPEHDDNHSRGELARAAACYALQAAQRSDETPYEDRPGQRRWRRTHLAIVRFWPLHWGWWKPVNRQRDLEKAGALIAAELDRVIRASAPATQGSSE